MLWLDGRPVAGTSAPFDLRDRGLMLGDGLFDTALVLQGTVVFGAAHLDRLARSCARFGLPFDRAAMAALLAQAARQTATGSLRLTVTRGPGPRGLAPPADAQPCTILAAFPGLPAVLWQPLTLAVAAIRRNETSPAAGHKWLSYVDGMLALQQAQAAGATDALLLNTQGRVACSSVGNVFALHGQTLTTPPEEDGILPGVVRAEVLAAAAGAGLAPRCAGLTPGALATADAVFVTNSLRLMSPVTALGGVALPAPSAPLRVLARALAARITALHGRIPAIEEGPDAWPMHA